jgi:hypothetical protein
MSVFERFWGSPVVTASYKEGEPVGFIVGHAARLYAVAVAVLALLAHYVPDMPTELVLGVVAAILGTGEAVQRAGDAKAGTGKHRADA